MTKKQEVITKKSGLTSKHQRRENRRVNREIGLKKPQKRGPKKK